MKSFSAMPVVIFIEFVSYHKFKKITMIDNNKNEQNKTYTDM